MPEFCKQEATVIHQRNEGREQAKRREESGRRGAKLVEWERPTATQRPAGIHREGGGPKDRLKIARSLAQVVGTIDSKGFQISSRSSRKGSKARDSRCLNLEELESGRKGEREKDKEKTENYIRGIKEIRREGPYIREEEERDGGDN